MSSTMKLTDAGRLGDAVAQASRDVETLMTVLVEVDGYWYGPEMGEDVSAQQLLRLVDERTGRRI